MSASRVQYKFADGASPQATFDSAPTQGNLLIAFTIHRSGTASASTSISGSGWTKVVARDCYLTNSSYRRHISCWYKIAGASEPSAIQVSGTDLGLLIQEFSTTDGGFQYLDSADDDNGLSTNGLTCSLGTTSSVSGDKFLKIGLVGTRRGAGTALFNVGSWTNDIANSLTFGQSNYGRGIATGFIDTDTTNGTKTSTLTYSTSPFPANTGHAGCILVFELASSGNDQSYTITDSITATDVLAVDKGSSKEVDETITITDSIALDKVLGLTDTVSVSDNVTVTKPGETHVWIDADTANELDDLYAITRAFVEPSFYIRGLSSCHHGITGTSDIDSAQSLNEDLVSQFGVTDTCVTPKGSADKMVDKFTYQQSDACDEIIRVAHEYSSGNKLNVLVLGAFTNIASAIVKDPTIAPKIRVMLMGFRYNGGTGITGNDFNAINDTGARDALIDETDLEIIIMPGDVSSSLSFLKTKAETELDTYGGIYDYIYDYWNTNYNGYPSRIMYDVAGIQCMVDDSGMSYITDGSYGGRTDLKVYTSISDATEEANFWDAIIEGRDNSVQANFHYDKTLSDSFTASDVVTVGKLKTVSDTINVSDTVQVDKSTSIQETINVSDNIILDRSFPITDTIDLSDSIIIDKVLVIADNINLSDSIILDKELGLVDNITVIEDIILVKDKVVTVSDDILVSDNITLDKNLSIVDNILLSDAITLDKNFAESDNIELTDTIVLDKDDLLSDVINLNDVIFIIKDKQVNEADTINISDNLLVEKAREQQVIDSVDLDDVVIVDKDFGIADSIGVVETITVDISFGISDTITISDEVTVTTAIEKNISDTIGVSDSVQVNKSIILADIISIYDEIKLDKSIRISDSISIDDAVNVLTELLHDLTDNISVSDEIVLDKSDVLNDVITLSDSIIVDKEITIADAISFIDVLTVEGSTQVNINENIVLSDNISLDKNMSISDLISVSDIVLVEKTQTISDSIIVTEIIKVDKDIRVQDSISINDLIGLLNKELVVSDSVIVSDVVISSMTINNVTISDNISVSDIVTVTIPLVDRYVSIDVITEVIRCDVVQVLQIDVQEIETEYIVKDVVQSLQVNIETDLIHKNVRT